MTGNPEQTHKAKIDQDDFLNSLFAMLDETWVSVKINRPPLLSDVFLFGRDNITDPFFTSSAWIFVTDEDISVEAALSFGSIVLIVGGQWAVMVRSTLNPPSSSLAALNIFFSSFEILYG